jgi:uncharacterized RDD family membrane protein YckC
VQWYYRHGDKRRGPLDRDSMCRMLADGRVPADAVVWRQGFDTFVPATSVEEFRETLRAVAYAAPVSVASPPPLPAIATTPSGFPSTTGGPAVQRLRGEAPQSLEAGSRVPFAGGQMVRVDAHDTGPDRVAGARPWVRFWARSLDDFFYGMLLFVVYPQMMLKPILDWHLLYIPLVFLVVESVFLASFSATPGKFLLGTRVLTAEGRRLSFGQALRRSAAVWVRGRALGLPLVMFFAQIVAWGVLGAEGSTTWDTRGNFVVRHARCGVIRIILMAIILPYAVLIAGVVTLAMRPDWAPHITRVLEEYQATQPHRFRTSDVKPVPPWR